MVNGSPVMTVTHPTDACLPVERSEWVSVIQDAMGDHRSSGDIGAHLPGPSSIQPTHEMQGYLELRGLRSKLYVVVSGDKVFLYKNLEVSSSFLLCIGVAFSQTVL